MKGSEAVRGAVEIDDGADVGTVGARDHVVFVEDGEGWADVGAGVAEVGDSDGKGYGGGGAEGDEGEFGAGDWVRGVC